jgi:hypothetical protein
MSLVADFYKDAQKEWDRLDIPFFRIEFATTLDLINTYFAAGERVAGHRGRAWSLHDRVVEARVPCDTS